MPRLSNENKNADRLISIARLPIAENNEETTLYREAVKLANERSFPVRMTIAIENVTLSEAAQIGYLRGLHDAALSINRPHPIGD